MGNCNSEILRLHEEVIACRKCERLVAYREEVARMKRRAFLEWDYWGKPVPSWGDPKACLLIVGLAPAAHGGNRTGRFFTGDRSGDFLFRALWENGFASQAESTHRDDGQRLTDAWITAVAHCAPPDNKPTQEEMRNCGAWLAREMDLLTEVRVVVALGRIAWDGYLRAAGKRLAQHVFAHGAETRVGAATLIGSYHPSQQNTSTRRLTAEMLRTIFARARMLAETGRSR